MTQDVCARTAPSPGRGCRCNLGCAGDSFCSDTVVQFLACHPPPPPPFFFPRRPYISFPVMHPREPGAFLGVPMRHARGARHARHAVFCVFFVGACATPPTHTSAPGPPPSPSTTHQFSGDTPEGTQCLPRCADATRARGQTCPRHMFFYVFCRGATTPPTPTSAPPPSPPFPPTFLALRALRALCLGLPWTWVITPGATHRLANR